jgi:hypothetical protein
MHILVELNGVLRNQDDAPIPVGQIMVGTLSAFHKITILSFMDERGTKHWLDSNKIVDMDDIIDSSVGLTDEHLTERQIKLARSRGAVDLFITGDPSMWAFAFEMGIPSVMMGQPSYLRPEFRPDAPKRLRAWNDIEEAIRKENIKRTNDARLVRTDEGLRFDG